MAIQHRQIPDTELHEPKGANTAIAGTVIRATGMGGTTFDFIGVDQLKGGVTNVEGLMLGIGPSGTFKAFGRDYATFTSADVGGSTVTTKQLGTGKLFVSGVGFKVAEAGVYMITFANPVLFSGDGATTPYSISQPTLRTEATSTPVFSGGSGLVELNTTDVYFSGQANTYSLVKIV